MSGLFGKASNAAQEEVYAGIQVSTSQYGQPIPYVAGRQRVPFTLLWYGNFVATANSGGGGKGGGGSGTKSYTYTTAFQAALCLGPIVGVYRVWHDKAIVTLTDENLALSEGGAAFTGSISGTTLTASSVIGYIQVGAAVTCAAVTPGTTITGLGTGSGGAGTYTISASQTVAAQTMSSSQMTWTGYPSGTPTVQKIPYDHMAYVATNLYTLGSSASMPNLSFEVEGSVPGFSDAYGMYDADPSAVIPQYLTGPVIGAGFQGTIQALTGSTNSYQAYVMSLGLLISPYENTQRAATDFTKEILQITNSDMVLSVGQMRIQPLGDTAVSATTPDGSAWSWTPNLTPEFIFTDDHYVPEKGEPPVKLTRRPLNDTHNMVNLEYVDRTNYYNTAPVNASIISDISLHGPRLMSGLTFHQITNAQTALTVAQLILQADLYERNSYEFRVRQDFCQLEPLDYIAINDSGLGLVNQVCRIQEVSDDADDFLTFKVLEMPGITRSTPQYNWNAAAGYFANYATAPGSIQAPAIFTMPAVPAAKAYTDGIVIGIAVAPLASQGYWGGCHCWMSVDGGSTYILAGIIPAAARYGTLTYSILAGAADPDVTHTLSVALVDTNQQISTATTHANADSMQTLCLIDTGSSAEVVDFGAAALISAGNYNLTYLRRGLYGSVNNPHAAGAQFVRLDGNVFTTAIDPGYGGQTLYFKFTSFNTWQKGEEALSAVTAYSYAVPSGLAVAGAVKFTARGNAALTPGVGPAAYKIAGIAAAWDSDVVSRQAYDALSVLAIWSIGQDMVFGLSSNIGATLNPNNTSGAGTLDFSFYVANGIWLIYEAGVNQATLSAAVAGDAASITYDRFTVRYYLNGTLQRSVPIAVPGTLEYIGFSMYEASDVWSGIEAGSGTVSTPQQFVVQGTSVVSDTNISKLSTGAASWIDAGAVSINGYKTCHIVCKANDTSGNFMMALDAGPPTAPGYTTLDYAMYMDGGVNLEAYESGVPVSLGAPTYKTTDYLAITYDGSTVTYWQNGTSLRTVSTSGKTLYGYFSLYTPGTGANSVEFGPSATIPLADTAQLGANAASVIASATYSGTLGYNVYSAAVSAAALSATLTATGVPVGIDVSCDIGFSWQHAVFASPMTLYVARDGVQVGVANFDLYSFIENVTPVGGGPTFAAFTQMSLNVVDTPSAASHTYSLYINCAKAGATGSPVAAGVSLVNPAIKVREYRK